MTNIHNFSLAIIVYCVPKPEMTENCRLHTKIFIGNDFYGQRATTIYCGTAYGWENGGYGSDIAINSKRSKLLVKQPFLKKANLCFLLYISGLDDTENLDIYKTYMHFARIPYIGKKTAIRHTLPFNRLTAINVTTEYHKHLRS